MFDRTRFVTPLLIAALCTPALAIKPQKWTHTTEADFDAGESEGVVVTSLGDVKLSRATTQVASLPEGSTVLFDMQDVGGTRYLAGGPQGVIYRLEGDKAVEVLQLEGEQVFALDEWDGKLLMAISGETGRIAVLEGDEAVTVTDLPGVRYLWDVLVDEKKGGLILATGVNGRVLHVNVARAGAAYQVKMAEQEAADQKAKEEAAQAAEADVAMSEAEPTDDGGAMSQPADATTENPATTAPDDVETSAPAMQGDDEAEADEAIEEASPAMEEADGDALLEGEAMAEGDAVAEGGEEDADDEPPLPDGVTTILDTAQANVLCLARDATGQVYAGTDTEGLVYRLSYEGEEEDLAKEEAAAAGEAGQKAGREAGDEAGPDAAADGGDAGDAEAEAGEPMKPATGPRYTAFVLYDAAEPEIGAIAVGPGGMIYAGTADAEGARPGRLEEASSAAIGRPSSEAVEAAAPTPPDAPPVGGGGDENPANPGDLPQVPPEPGPIGDGDGDGPIVPAPEPTADMPEVAGPEAESPTDPTVEPDAKDPANNPDAEGTPQAPMTAADATVEQLDQLRQAIRDRLMAARKSGSLQVSPGGMGGGGNRSASGSTRSRSPRAATQQSEGGNAVYRIDPQGFVSEVFRESVMILKIVPTPDGRLLIGTGNEGQVYSVNPAQEETTILADIESEQIPAMMIEPDGRVLLGTANPARVLTLEPGNADSGTFTSNVLDATSTSLWGTLNLTARVPDGATLAVQTRTGNVGDPDEAAWSKWAQAAVFTPDADRGPLQPLEAKIDSPPARYLQYRLQFNGGRDATPTVDGISLAYIVPNIRPSLTSITASYNEPPTGPNAEVPPAPDPTLNVTWEAADANTDSLLYTLEYLIDGTGQPLTIADDLAEGSYAWNTRTVPDGRYLLKVTATDSPDNPGTMARTASRRSDPILVDNTPPTLDGLDANRADANATLTGTAQDALAGVASIAYTVDSGDTYTPVLPDDLIFDSTSEAFNATIPDLTPGPHVVTLRIRDARGNTLYQNVLVP